MGAAMTEADPLTIDEVARLSGLPSSTIRLYQNRGLLPAPTRAGRTAHYGPHHLRRLELIAHLQDRGFSLAAIKAVADAWAAGEDLSHLLAEFAGDPRTDTAVALTPDDLGRFFPNGLDGGAAAAALRLGLVELDGNRVTAPSRRLYELGGRMVDLGIPTEVILDEFEQTQDMARRLAARFADRFAEHVLPGTTDLETASLHAAELTRTVAGLVRELLEQALEAEGTSRLQELLPAEAGGDTDPADPADPGRGASRRPGRATSGRSASKAQSAAADAEEG